MRSHLAECAELLLSITLPACLGFAVISHHVANVVLGVDFRDLAADTMPIVAIAVIFQILTQQYLHASFLLSGRNSFYLINTASIIAANVVLSYVLVSNTAPSALPGHGSAPMPSGLPAPWSSAAWRFQFQFPSVGWR